MRTVFIGKPIATTIHGFEIDNAIEKYFPGPGTAFWWMNTRPLAASLKDTATVEITILRYSEVVGYIIFVPKDDVVIHDT